MGIKPDSVQTNFTGGEISPRALGRFDIAKYANSVETLENFLIYQLGGVVFRPGTRFAAETKTSANRSRLLKFQYSTTQGYIIEAGDLYFRFYTEAGQLLLAGVPVELVTPFALANLTKIKYTQNADTMYLTTGTYTVRKLTRTSATTFTITEVAFVRGPFLDTNITAVNTITPSSATGATTLTGSGALSTFSVLHIGSLWRIKNGVVKITGWTSATVMNGVVQDEPDGTPGNLGTTTATVDWAEGSWSGVRGYPKVVNFHEGRLYFAHTTSQPGGVWGSVPFAYENFKEGPDDDNALNIELNANTVCAIRWLSSSPKGLQAGTTGGVFLVSSGSQGLPITPDNISAPQQSFDGSADIQGKRMLNNTYYASNDLQRFFESGYQFDVDSVDSLDTTLLADHILNAPLPTNTPARGDNETGGIYEIDSQQSPNDRLWIVRNDGQIAVLTRNVRQEITGWGRVIGGATVSCDGKSGIGIFESTAIMQLDGAQDIVWVISNRIINGSVKRFVEYFTKENFKYDWDPVRVDCSLTLDSPISITAITLSNPIVVTAPAHGLSNGNRVRLDNIVGTHQLNGQEFEVQNVATNTFDLYEVS